MSPALLVLFLGLSQLPGEPVRPDLAPVEETDLIWFPPAAVVVSNLELANAHISWLQAMRKSSPSRAEEWDEWLGSAECAKRPWQLLSNARSYSTVWYLGHLRHRLGNRAYYGGHMPSPLPLHYFREIR